MFKNAIATQSLERLIQEVKLADIVFLDDVGGEAMSQFIRDEVLDRLLMIAINVINYFL